MKLYTVLVKETRLVEYYITAETSKEAKAQFENGQADDYQLIKVEEEKVMDIK